MPFGLEPMLLLPAALLALSVSHVLGHALEPRDAQSTQIPSPISFNPDQNWDGIDGSWSSFTLRIGTPPQYVRTFASWSSYQTWAVLPVGCSAAPDEQDCENARGWIFDQTKSNTFDRIDIFGIEIEENLGYQSNAIFGYDTVGLGGAGEEGPTLKHTVVGGMAYPDYYLGVLGLNPKPTNFTSFNDPSTSYMTLLKDQKYIPSVSLGYTAGAKYRYTGELASLTLGGYDSSKFVENDVVFSFAPDNSRDIVVAIQSITTPSQGGSSNPTSLLPSPVYAYMDVTVAEIWLPTAACKAFESEFGLQYDTDTGLYLVSDSLHQDLTDRNPTITFVLGTDLSDGKTVSIELPYDAFDLTAKPPYRDLTDQSYYFPLRRAMNDSQYTIGRTFFQEAYIRIDYESQKFNVSQRSWNQNAQPHIVAIAPYIATDGSTTYPGVSSNSSPSSGISGGIIAVIAIGVALLIAIISVALFLYLRSRRGTTKEGQHEKLPSEWGSMYNTARGDSTVRSDSVITGVQQDPIYHKAELAGSLPVINTQFNERRLHSSGGISEVESNTPRTPRDFSGSAFPGSVYSASTSPTDGYGTRSSTMNATAVGSVLAGMSALTPIGEPIYEMAADLPRPIIGEKEGDIPVVGEMDGKALSEKEALAYREKVYNGVESTTTSPSDDHAARRELPQRVNPEDVITGDTVIGSTWPSSEREFQDHRAFSFEEQRANDAQRRRSEEDLYS